jgi:hypothetical protein
MVSDKKIPHHQILVNSLNSWATLYSVNNDPYVLGLINAVSARKNLPMWASLDPLEYLPHAQIDNHKKLHLAVLIMSVIRNALVFLPVALTWYAIGKATSAFSVYTSDNSLSVVNFLDFWENGYGVLSEKWSLSSVAIFDFQIILVIIILTIIITFLDRALKNSKNRDTRQADDDRIQMALAIATYLFDQQRVTNVTLNQSLSRAIRDILNSTESLDKSTKELNKTVKVMPNNRELLNEIKNIKSKIFSRDLS